VASPITGADTADDPFDDGSTPRSVPDAPSLTEHSGHVGDLLTLLIAIATIRVRRRELTGAVPEPREAAAPTAVPQAVIAQQIEDRSALAKAVRTCRYCCRHVTAAGARTWPARQCRIRAIHRNPVMPPHRSCGEPRR
jgi:hypothetical protein